MDARVLAVLGVLSAVNAVLRGFGAGTAGIEMVFFLLVLGGRVFGAAFGFALGCTSLFASALLTAGVGPWLPFQMICAAWVGMGAGFLPRRVGGRAEIAMLVGYAVVASYLYGILMNLSSWPFTLGIAVPGHEGSLSYVAGAPLLENLHRFGVYTVLTSTGGWDTGRAITTALAIVVLGPAILTTLRRAARRAVSARESGPDDDDPVVGGRRLAAAVPVRRGEPQLAVGGGDDGPQPAVVLGEERRRPRRLAALRDPDPPQPLPAQPGHPQVPVGVRQPARRRLLDRPDQRGVDELGPATGALDLGPAVVAALLDEVELVPRRVAELRGPEPPRVVPRQALDVAVAERPDGGGRGRGCPARAPRRR